MTNVIELRRRDTGPCWPPPPEYVDARSSLSTNVDTALDGLPEHHLRAVLRARQECPGRADELRALFRILNTGRRMDAIYRRRWSA
jgi:hypothetical protein